MSTDPNVIPSPAAAAARQTDPQPAQAPAAGQDRVAAAVNAWKTRLLDLTKRNRALSFRSSKVATVAIVDEQPAEVFRQLQLRHQAMRFKAAPETAATAVEVEAKEPQTSVESPVPATLLEDEDDTALGTDFVPYDPTELDERHTDGWLQTSSAPEALDRSLRRLEEQARLSIEEQGVNTLFLALGMLTYTEPEAPGKAFRAPLVLLPVALSRKSARAGYEVRATDDDPLVNPALTEYLRGRGVVLPELPDFSNTDDYDLQCLFSAVAAQVSVQPSWAVKTDIYLGLFSFQKFVMYKDLEANAAAMSGHRLIQQLITRSGGHAIGLPAEIRDMQLDEEFPPEATSQVVNADSSQLRAIAATARGHDLVIEGPPGTGKSQTITNLIAAALAADRSVLFVAEKMAALEVVYDRLVEAGLGEFCLELHSTKANKRAVIHELGAALDASLQQVAAPQASTQRLPQVRHTLTAYTRAVHTPFGALGASPYRIYGELGHVLGARRVKLDLPIEAVSRQQLEQAVRDLGDLAAASAAVGTPAEHPWRDTLRTFYSEDDLETVREHADDVAARTAELAAGGEDLRTRFGLPPIRGFADLEIAAEVAGVLARSPGAPLAVLCNEAWNAPPAEALALVERGRELERLKEQVKERFTAGVLTEEHAADIAYVERKAEGALGFLAWLDGRWRTIRKRWLAYRLPAFQGSLLEQAAEMKQVDRLRAEQAALAAAAERGRELFGSLWDGERSKWDVLDGYIRWVVEFRGACVKHGLDARAAEVASGASPDVSRVETLRLSARQARLALGRLRDAAGWPAEYLDAAPLEEISRRAAALSGAIEQGPRWAAFESARQVAAAGIAGELVPPALAGQIPFAELAPAFLRAFYMKWLTMVVQEREPLARFNTLTHEERVAEFRRLDEQVLKENRAALVGQLRDRVQHRLQHTEAAASFPYLRGQMARQRNLAPLRRTMQQAQSAIRAIKPCLMMSPLSVAQYLDGGQPGFDVVIFDEASQLPPEDAVGAISRGRHLVVVGDPKQLPPTNFFAVQSGLVDTPLADDGTPLVDDAESILEQFMGAGVPHSRLRWHYRSAHESLINFSNRSFYEADLYTFPSVERGATDVGLRFEHVADGVYEGKGVNSAEARRVADEVVRFAQEQAARRERGEPVLSLGVGTFNLRQQLAIQDELERRRRADPSIEPFFDRGNTEPFFVKNLENIQGDERDAIFISVTYAKGPDGKLRHNFGPLNGANGWRRLNVLVTRARQQMRVFSSMRGDEISATATSSDGPRLLREFLLYAERGRLESDAANAAAQTDSPFELDVMHELSHRGVTVEPQVGVTGYRIDLGVLDDAVPGRFLCGIECDGVAYHASATARDRDRLRQQVLEARGWTIHRVWSTDWFKDRKGQIERLVGLIELDRARAREDAEAERAARASAAEQVAEEAARAAREAAEAVAFGPAAPYVRPVAAPYAVTPGEGQYSGRDFLNTPIGQVVDAIVQVVRTESPVHRAELTARITAMWKTRAGGRIQSWIDAACAAAGRAGLVERRGEFFWAAPSPGGTCVPRSRAGIRMAADRIAPEEYHAAVLAILEQGHAFSPSQLTNEVRTLLGYSRTGAALDEAISTAVADLQREGRIGEASTGIRIRRSQLPEPPSPSARPL
jgi:very-short-patch-repair endonuclease